MTQQLKDLWVEKYRPKSIDDYIFQNKTHEKQIRRFVREQSIPHVLFSGHSGTGKTALAKLLQKELNVDPIDFMIINASDENNVDTVREKIKGFVTTYPIGPFRLIFLDEADYLTPAGQGALRKLMVDYQDTARFILACNYIHKIVVPLQSRCQEFQFKSFDVNDLTDICGQILIAEEVKFKLERLDKFIAVGYPDVRKIINLLEQHSPDKVLLEPGDTQDVGGDYKLQMLDMLATDDWNAIRKLTCAQVAAEEWDDVYRFLYDNLNKSSKFKARDKWEEGIIVIAEHLYRNSICADPEINAAALFIRLSQI